MKILVVGTGGVGGSYGAMLARAGHDVTLVARGEHGEAIREHGLVVDFPGEQLVVRPKVIADVREAAGLGADVAIVAVKASSLADVASGVGAALADGGVALPLLNGLDSEEELARVLGRERVIGGVAQIAASIAAPGRIHVHGPARIILSPLEPGQAALVQRIAEAFALAGFGCDVKADLARVLWTKLLWNAPFNAICALTGRNAGAVLEVPALEALVRAAMHELAAVARAEGVAMDDRFIEAMIDATRTKYADSVPSMLQDVRAGRPTEADALQGAVVTRGEKHGIPTPVHRTLHALVSGLSAHRT